MPKKLIVVSVVTMFFTLASLTHANVIINEFVSNGTTEWVELRNTSGSEISLEGWILKDAADHVKSITALGAIPSQGIVVYEYDASSAGWLNNGGDYIELSDGTSEIDSVVYGVIEGYSADLSAPVAGKSGALINGDWETNQEPTKGQANPSSSSNTNENEENEEDEEDNTPSSSTKSKSAPAPVKKTYTPKVEITAGRVAHVGVPFSFEGKGTGETGGPILRGKYFWNFGDGDFREVRATTREKFTHMYFYPGEYTVVFDYYADSFAEDPVASDQAVVKVIEPEIVISRVGDVSDFFVEITNETDSSADISYWMLLSAYKVFTFPKNTVLGAGKSMIIAPAVSKFSPVDAPTLRLMTPEREIISSYLGMGSTPVGSNVLSQNNISSVSSKETGINNYEEENISSEDMLPAFAFGGLENNDADPKSSSSVFGFAGLIFLLSGSVMAVYFIRRKRLVTREGDDFEILDE